MLEYQEYNCCERKEGVSSSTLLQACFIFIVRAVLPPRTRCTGKKSRT